MVYGCNVSSDGGNSFINALALITGADIAASDDATGDAARGGDWDLESSIGTIESTIPLSASAQVAYGGLLVSPSDQGFTTEPGAQSTGYGFSEKINVAANSASISWSDSKGWTYTIINNDSASDSSNWKMAIESGPGYQPNAAIGNSFLNVLPSGFSNQVFDVFTFSSTDGSEFKLNSFYVMANSDIGGVSNETVTITGYRDGVAVSGATTTITSPNLNNSTLGLVDVSADTDFQNVDEIRITLSSGIAQVWLDAIDISAAVVPAPNNAPTIDSAASVSGGSTTEDASTSGTSVSSLLTSSGYADADSGDSSGIAITGLTGNGTWQYSTDSGNNWYSFTASTASSLLLSSTAQIRYTPDGQNAETATITYKAWDQTSGTASSGSTARTADTTSSGGTTAFSSNTGTLTSTVTAVNDAPTVTNGSTATLSAINEGATGAGTQLSSLLTSFSYADVDTGYASGLAITGMTGTGTWQYSLDGSTGWTTISSISSSAALLLTSSTYVRFISTGNDGGTATLAVKGWDQTSGSAGSKVDTTSSGGTTAFSSNSATISQTVNAVNDAPTITGGATVTLTTTNEDTASSGTTVASILASAGYADVDTGASSGIAITATVGNGAWQYTTDGTNWYAIGTVSSSSALLLSSTTQIRYNPDNTSGETATITFKAWDQTLGSATTGSIKGTADTSSSGGSSAFSSQTATGSITVTDVNDAPTVTGGSTASTDNVTEGTTGTAKQVSDLLTSLGSGDVDTGAVSGVAITASSGTGTWQYSTDGTTWTDVGAVTSSAALLLTSSSYVRFVSTGTGAETATLTVKIWDQTSGSASTNGSPSTADTTTSGGTSAFSSNTGTINSTVVELNDAPTVTNGATTPLTTTDEDTPSSGTTVSSILSGVGYSDLNAGASSGIAITALTGNGTWQYNTDGTWYDVGTVSATSALLLSSSAQLRFNPDGNNGESATLTFKAWDQTTGTATTGATKGTADTSTSGGTSAFSTNSASATITVSSVNDAPTVTNGHTYTMTTTNEDTTSGSQSVSAMITAASGSDVDTGATTGMAITSVTGNGTWQYSTDGTTWTSFGTVSGAAALLLSSTSLVRYVPDSANGETATFTYKAWDTTSGSASANGVPSTADTTTSGGTSAFSTNSASASLTVSSVNDAPTVGGSVTTTDINDNSGANTLFGGLVIGDVDTGATVTVTVTVNTAAAGTLSGGGFVHQGNGVYTLTGVSAAAATTALDSLAFTPTNNTASSGTATTTFTIDVSDGTASASTTSSALTINRVNDAPDIGTTTPSLGTTPTNVARSGQISSWLNATDSDTGDSVGIAIAGVSEAVGGGTGVWAYSIDGGVNWTDITGVSMSAALLLRSSDYLRYTPGGVGEETNSATITYRTWDGTTGTAGGTADTTSNGGTTAFSAASTTGSMSITEINASPTITDSATVTLTGMTEDQTSGATTVSTILTSAGHADANAGALSGLAITATTGNGTWQYSTDGITWTSFGTVSATSALLLTSTTQVRYIGDGENGETATFSFKAWDQTSGDASVNGTPRTGDTSTTGGEAAYSTGSATASITVSSVNDAPTVTSGSSSTLTSVDENTTSTGKTVASLLTAAGMSDVDQGASLGLAITATTGNGAWQFSTDNVTWTDFGTVSTNSALLLNVSSYVRYVPDGENGETATFTFKGWDKSTGTESSNGSAQKSDASSTGGTTAYSTNNASLSITVTSVNDAPVMTTTTTINAAPMTEDDTSSATPVSALVAASDVDTGTSIGIAITSVVANGTLQYSLDGTTWHDVGTVSETSALLLPPTAQLRSVGDGKNGETATFTFRAWDQSSGTAATKADTSTNGGTSAFSTATRTVSQVVTDVNDAPVAAGATLSGMSAILGQASTYVVPDSAFTDVDSTLTYSATLVGGAPLPSWVVFDPATKTFTVTATTIETIQVVVTATDGIAAAVSSTMDITVVPPQQTTVDAPQHAPPAPMASQPLMGLSQSGLTTAPTAQPTFGTGLVSNNTPIAASLAIGPSSFGLSTAQSGPIPTAVTGSLGSISQLDNTGTPVNAGLSEARSNSQGGGLALGQGGGLGGGLGGSLGQGGGFFGSDNSLLGGGGLGQGLGGPATGGGDNAGGAPSGNPNGAPQGGSAAPTNGAEPSDGGAPADGAPSPGDNQADAGQAPSDTGAHGVALNGDNQSSDSQIATAVPFNRQLSSLNSGVIGRHGVLIDALDAHTLPSTAA
jgi:hypothetical protein